MIVCLLILNGCDRSSPEITRLQARPGIPTVAIESGEHALGLGGMRLVNRGVIWRDGVFYVPALSDTDKPLPLLVWLHGGGGRADAFRYMFPLAQESGVVILALDARHNTWDGIDSGFGPDVEFMDAALQFIFQRVAIDPDRIALGGLSDGGAYALALGRANGDLFTHLVAFAPGGLNPPSAPIGQPKIFVAHGTHDNVYHISGSRHYIVPRLKSAAYDVSFVEFDGPHWAPAPIVSQVLKWLKQ
ncbi:MAG: hypothetical protein H8E21_05250 [Gammaproteobacteria bacterium]|nr:hypothetical protein [Gammaproteobacteria bacterium]MBL6999080.1 hypothetical protein [Gammaproteobacteria bacterium]